MRNIPKPKCSEARTLLDNARKDMQKAGISETYDKFRDKEKLNDILRKEQKNICCYCQRRINHFQGMNEQGSHNEHFFPEKGKDARMDLQLEYENIFACCNISKGFERRLQHCGEHKGSEKINRNFLTMNNCSDYFKYNTNGEILPQCSMNSYEEVCLHRDKLTNIQQEALQMIEVLNLNADSLKDFRRNVQADLFKIVLGKSKNQLEHIIRVWNTELNEYVQLIDMVLYYLKIFAKNK